MKQTAKKLLCLLLALCVMGSLTPVLAADAPELLFFGSGEWINPLYPDAGAPASENDVEAETTLAPSPVGATYVTVSEALLQMRDHMKARDTAFTLYIYDPAGLPEFSVADACSEDLATGVNTGDYLQWSWAKSNYYYYAYSGDRYIFVVEMVYYTNAAQEKQFLSDLGSLMEELDLWRVSDYRKYCGIYDYITNHVDYATEGLERGDTLIYTAYSALEYGTAVCQGYAALMYAMCRSMGLPVRIVTGMNHAWNIVAIDGVYYYMDATWERPGTRDNFLKGSDHFTDHKSAETYRTAEFTAAHPISRTDYAPTAKDSQPVSPFRDVPESSYYYAAIDRVTEHGLFKGTSGYTFSPEGTMTRAMLVTVLWRMAGSPAAGTRSGFQDVAASSYYAEAVTWAKSMGIANGISDTRFGPNQTLTREQAAVFLYRYATAMGYNVSAFNNLAAYSDIAKAGSYSIPALRWAVGAGIINGTGGAALDPKGSATRGQMAVMMDRFMTYYQLY